jgi:hypothetical protein
VKCVTVQVAPVPSDCCTITATGSTGSSAVIIYTTTSVTT